MIDFGFYIYIFTTLFFNFYLAVKLMRSVSTGGIESNSSKIAATNMCSSETNSSCERNLDAYFSTALNTTSVRTGKVSLGFRREILRRMKTLSCAVPPPDNFRFKFTLCELKHPRRRKSPTHTEGCSRFVLASVFNSFNSTPSRECSLSARR